MPNPFVILDNHLSVGSKQFITENVLALKNMGYTKLLLEMNREISPEAMKQQLKTILSAPSAKTFHASSQALYSMLIALETNGIAYEFIDPETQSEGLQQNILLEKARQTGKLPQAIAHREQLTNARDKIMAPNMMQQSKQQNGGVILIVGFHHRHLVHLLESTEPNTYRYALFANSSRDQALDRVAAEGNTQWDKMPDERSRRQFYQANVQFFDLAKTSSFELIEAECQLADARACAPPLVGLYLNKSMQQSFDYILDSHSVLTATAPMEEEPLQATIKLLKKEFQGLRFFTEERGEKTILNIPGVNLPEHMECLKKGFAKLGIMGH